MDSTNTLSEIIRRIPELPGIYKMLDSYGNIIYIGKSKCLRKRVRSYFTGSPKQEKITRMVSMIKNIEYTVTDTHLEARLLECELIKYHQPRFNAQMKNDRRYSYIRIDRFNPHHSLSVVGDREADCFGPFRSKYKMEEFIEKLKNLYPICGSSEGYEVEYHIFPVKMDREVFEMNRIVLLELFTEEANIDLLNSHLQQKLLEAAELYRYEIASYYRDIMTGFSNLKHGLDGYKDLSTRDILLTLPAPGGFKLFYASCGNIIHSLPVSEVTDEVVQGFLEQSLILRTSYVPVTTDEKSRIDYRDILYSEISDLPEDMVRLI